MTGATNQIKLNSSGFTLIETVVALGIFSIFTILIVSSFSQYTFSQKRDIGEQELQEDARLALEVINREIRTGFGNTYSSDGSTLSFINQNGQCAFFTLINKALMRAENSPMGSACVQPENFTVYQPLTNPGTEIHALNFIVDQATFDNDNPANNQQGLVTTTLTAIARDKPELPLHIQTTITSRQLSAYE
jgi:prepilin-type N-terminal cleavage/methylation domain-containing protein